MTLGQPPFADCAEAGTKFAASPNGRGASKSAVQRPSPAEWAAVTLSWVALCYTRHDCAEALALFQTAEQTAPHGGDVWRDILLCKSVLLNDLALPAQARQEILRARAADPPMNDRMAFMFNIALARADLLLGHTSAGWQLAEHVLGQSELWDESLMEGECLRLVSEACLRTGERDRALRYAERAVAAHRRSECEPGLIAALRAQAEALLAVGQPEAASSLLAESLTRSQLGSLPLQAFWTLTVLTETFLRLGDAPRTRRCWSDAFALTRGCSMDSLARVAIRLREKAPALRDIDEPEHLAAAERIALLLMRGGKRATATILANTAQISRAAARALLRSLCRRGLVSRRRRRFGSEYSLACDWRPVVAACP